MPTFNPTQAPTLLALVLKIEGVSPKATTANVTVSLNQQVGPSSSCVGTAWTLQWMGFIWA